MRLLVVITYFLCLPVFGQKVVDEHMQNLIATYTKDTQLKCEITVNIQVEGMQIPTKTVLVDFEEGKTPKIEGKGLTLLPKKGMVNHFQDLLNTDLQAIFIKERNGNLFYKLVSLDEKSHWITADVIFDKEIYQIYEAVVNTRKHGTFKAVHTYKEGKYPSESRITFNVKKFKLPLKFIGRQSKMAELTTSDEQTEGVITLQYEYLP